MSVKMSELMSDNAGLMEDARKEVKKAISASKPQEEAASAVTQRPTQIQTLQQLKGTVCFS